MTLQPILAKALADTSITSAAISDVIARRILAALAADPATTEAVAAALHDDCLRDWATEEPGTIKTRHMADAHEARAARIVRLIFGAAEDAT